MADNESKFSVITDQDQLPEEIDRFLAQLGREVWEIGQCFIDHGTNHVDGGFKRFDMVLGRPRVSAQILVIHSTNIVPVQGMIRGFRGRFPSGIVVHISADRSRLVDLTIRDVAHLPLEVIKQLIETKGARPQESRQSE